MDIHVHTTFMTEYTAMNLSCRNQHAMETLSNRNFGTSNLFQKKFVLSFEVRESMH